MTGDAGLSATLRAQIEADGVTDAHVLQVMQDVPRALFVPEAFRDRAYENTPLPIGLHQTISQPTVVAMMTEALQLNDRAKVLEIGTGCGYQTSVLAKLSRRVYTVERHRPLHEEAVARFDRLGFTNIVAKYGDGSLGWPEQAPFSRIIVTAAAVDVPEVLLSQLADDGVMVVPVGHEERTQDLLRIVKQNGDIQIADLGPVRFVPLISDEEVS